MATKKKKQQVKKNVVKKKVKKAVKAAKAVKKPTKKSVAKKAVAKKPVAKKPVAKKAVAQQPVKKPVVKAVPKMNVDYSKAITPLGDRLVVKVATGERITAGGLIIPDCASLATGYLKATVLAVGAGGKNKKGLLRPLDVKVGDNVLFSEHAGTKVTFNSEELQIIHESDVMGIVQN